MGGNENLFERPPLPAGLDEHRVDSTRFNELMTGQHVRQSAIGGVDRAGDRKNVALGWHQRGVVASLDRPVGGSEEARFVDFVAHDGDDLVETVYTRIVADALHRAVATLPARERLVIVLRYGLGGGGPASVEETRRVLGLPREQTIRLEQRALRRLARERRLCAACEAA